MGGVLSYRDYVGPAQGPQAVTLEDWRKGAISGAIPSPAWQGRFSATFSHDELLAELRGGRLRDEMYASADLAMGEVLAEMLAHKDSFQTEMDGSGFSQRDRAVMLFGLTRHPKVVEMLLPAVQKWVFKYDNLPRSWYDWAEARALEGNLTEEHALQMKKWIDQGYSRPKLLLGLMARVPGQRVEDALLEYLDCEAKKGLGRWQFGYEYWSGGPPPYYYHTALETVIHGLLDRPGLSVSRKLSDRLDTYSGAPLEVLAKSLRDRWSEPSYDGILYSDPDRTYSKEEMDFVRALKPRLEAAKKRAAENELKERRRLGLDAEP